MKILVVAYSEPGHINPTFRLAKRLQDAGCEVVYAVYPRFRDYVTARGFQAVDGPRSLLQPFIDSSFLETIEPAAFFEAEMSEFSRTLDEQNPDGVLFDRLLLLCGLQACAQGIPSLCYSVQMPDTWDPISPPWTTTTEPPRSARGIALNLKHWHGIAKWNRQTSREHAAGPGIPCGDCVRAGPDRWSQQNPQRSHLQPVG